MHNYPHYEINLSAQDDSTNESCGFNFRLKKCGVELRARIARVMGNAAKQYIEYRDGEYTITGSRILLDSLVYDFREGSSPESLHQSFPTLTLAEVFGALAFYLDHQAEIDAYLKRREEEYAARYQAARAQDPEFYQRLEAVCRKTN